MLEHHVHPDLAGIPASRHEAACASGSVAILAASAEIEAERYGLALVLGIELMRNVPGQRAAEYGRWTAGWKDAPPQSGPYLAVWRRVTGQWMIESETFVTTS